MLFQVVAVLLGGLRLAESFHVRPTRKMPVAFPRLRMTIADGSSPTAVSSVVAEPSKDETFNWNKQWYPVLCAEHTDPGRAQPVQILGKDLVVWRDKEERWTCFDDRCPHRAAPLTEGRVEDDGSLLCAYHAWRFDADGKCLSIPQSDSGGRDEAQPKACAKVYPTQVAQGVIWVWGDNGPDAALESALATPALIPELDDEELVESGRVVDAGVNFSDLAYGWDTFMENVVDASHVPAAHHGIAGDRYKDVRPLHLKLDETWPASPAQGFRFNFFDEPTGTHNACTFLPPALVINENNDPGSGAVKLYLYATPSKPGWCRIITRQIFKHRYAPKSEEAKELVKENKRLEREKTQFAAITKFARLLPAWVGHPLGSLFLYQDLIFLHHQEKILASAGYDSSTYNQAVYVPAESDRAVMTLRRWITKFGSGGPAWDKGCDPALPPREHNREALFNVFENHTKNCSTCLRALKNIKRTLAAAKASAVVSFAWAILRGARATASSSGPVLNTVTARAMLPALALMLASLGANKAVQKFHDLFHVYTFHHQDNP